MSITAYWKATTGFNVEDYPVTLGKPVNQCSNAELIAHPLCGSISPYNNVGYSVAVEETIGGNGSRIGYVAGSAGFTYPINSYHSEEWTVGSNPSDDIRKQYRRTIFVACPTNINLPARCITDQCNSGILIVENITAPNKLVQLYGNTPSSGSFQSFTVNISTQCRHTCQRGQSVYSSAPNQVQYTDQDTQTTTSYYIYPVWYYEYNNVSYLFREEFHESFGGVYRQGEPDEHNYNYITCNSSYRASFSTITPYVLAMGYNPNASSEAKALIDVVGRNAYADPIPDPAQFITTPLDFPTFNLAPDGAGVVVGLTMSNSTQAGYRVCTLNMQLWAGNEWYRAPAFCRAGTYFVNNGELLKPIIKDGIVVGYGETDAESEIDEYTDLNHPVPSTPDGGGGGGSEGDDMEAMATGATGSSGGFTHFYVMSPQDLIDFLADFYTRASSGETLTNNLVCSYILGIPSTEFCATEEVPIAIHNSAQGTPFVSQDNYSHITATNNLLVVGSFDVPRITNTFYDFAPYSTYEVFIPCCGWVSLPDTVAGRRINVEMYIDIASCCLKAAVKTNDLGVCAVTNGVLGAAIPIAVIESGILRGNNIQAGLGIIGGGINTGVGAGSGNAMGIGFGVQQILSGLVECTIAGNTNYTQQKGGTGDITQFAMGHKCYMKVTHPDIDPVVNESIFGHSVGYLCNSIGELSNFKGFTVCGNPHVTFSASAEEREEIERLLSMGVIL